MTKAIPVKCTNCEKESNRTLTNIKTGTRCKHCVIPTTRLLKYDEVNDIYTQNGIKLLWNEKEFSEKFTGCDQKIPVICICDEKFNDVYKGMNSPITILCKCDKEYTVRINDVKNGRSCKECGLEKIINTNMERYGVPYAIQNEEIKEKIRNTNMERYGVENPFLSEEIKEKIRNINF